MPKKRKPVQSEKDEIEKEKAKVAKESISNDKNVQETSLKPEESIATGQKFDMSSKLWLQVASKALKSSIAEKALKSCVFVGAHVSIVGGIDKAPIAAAKSGCRAFGLFLRSQRSWKLSPDNLKTFSMAAAFRENCDDLCILPKHILPHGSYLLNAGSPDPAVLEKTRQTLIHELKMCEMLGLPYYNFHPGSTCGKVPLKDCLKTIAETVNIVLDQTKSVTIVLETMAGQGNTVGGRFEEFKSIIDQIDDKSRIGICLDTCHVFAAGYDIRTGDGFDKVMLNFDSNIGLKYLKGIHLNDSKGQLCSKLDRHENIGRGKLGLECFRFIMNDSRFHDLPIILETPPEMSDSEELSVLYNLLR